MLFDMLENHIRICDVTTIADLKRVPRDASNALGRVSPGESTAKLNFLAGLSIRSGSYNFLLNFTHAMFKLLFVPFQLYLNLLVEPTGFVE
jgi:hypothetical protein